MNKKIKTSASILLLITIFAISINLRPAITSVGPMLDIIREQLLLSNAQVTLLTAIPVISMGIFASLSPYFNRIFGLNRTMYFMLIIIGTMTAFRLFWSSYYILLITALLIGIAIAVIGPLLSAMIKQNFPEQTASVIGVYSFGMGVGSAMSAGLTGFFYEKTNSYLFALGIWSLFALIGIVFWFCSLKSDLKVKEQRQMIEQEIVHRKNNPWKHKKAWLFLLFFGLQSAAFFSIITWLVPIAISVGLTLIQAGSLLTLMTTVQIFLNIIIPLLMERFFSREFWLFFMIFAGIFSIILLWTGVPYLLWIGAFVMGIPLGGLFPIALLLPLDETHSTESANEWTAMMQTGGFVIGGILPFVIGLVYDLTFNHHYTLLIMLILYVMMMGITFSLKEKDSLKTRQ